LPEIVATLERATRKFGSGKDFEPSCWQAATRVAEALVGIADRRMLTCRTRRPIHVQTPCAAMPKPKLLPRSAAESKLGKYLTAALDRRARAVLPHAARESGLRGLVSIPLVAAFVTWTTSGARSRWCSSRSNSSAGKPWFGWQGVIPRKARRMSGILSIG